jgi:hypothetical protein
MVQLVKTKVRCFLVMTFAALLAGMHRAVHMIIHGAWNMETAIGPIEPSHDADKHELEFVDHSTETQLTQIAPPPRLFDPTMQFDPSPWYDDFAQDDWEIAIA